MRDKYSARMEILKDALTTTDPSVETIPVDSFTATLCASHSAPMGNVIKELNAQEDTQLEFVTNGEAIIVILKLKCANLDIQKLSHLQEGMEKTRGKDQLKVLLHLRQRIQNPMIVRKTQEGMIFYAKAFQSSTGN